MATYFDERESRVKTVPDCARHGLKWNGQRCERAEGSAENPFMSLLSKAIPAVITNVPELADWLAQRRQKAADHRLYRQMNGLGYLEWDGYDLYENDFYEFGGGYGDYYYEDTWGNWYYSDTYGNEYWGDASGAYGDSFNNYVDPWAGYTGPENYQVDRSGNWSYDDGWGNLYAGWADGTQSWQDTFSGESWYTYPNGDFYWRDNDGNWYYEDVNGVWSYGDPSGYGCSGDAAGNWYCPDGSGGTWADSPARNARSQAQGRQSQSASGGGSPSGGGGQPRQQQQQQQQQQGRTKAEMDQLCVQAKGPGFSFNTSTQQCVKGSGITFEKAVPWIAVGVAVVALIKNK